VYDYLLGQGIVTFGFVKLLTVVPSPSCCGTIGRAFVARHVLLMLLVAHPPLNVGIERELKVERTAAGRAAAKARGRTGGRPRTDPEKLEHARILSLNSRKSAAEVCQTVGIGRRPFFSYLAQNDSRALFVLVPQYGQ